MQNSSTAGDVQIPVRHPHQQDVALVPCSEEVLLAKGMSPRSSLLLPRSTGRLPAPAAVHQRDSSLQQEDQVGLGNEESPPWCQVWMHNLLAS